MMNATTYEALPFAYIGAGLLNAVLLDSPLKYLPVILLIGAGLLVMGWRRQARARLPVRSPMRGPQDRRRLARGADRRQPAPVRFSRRG